MSKMISQVDGYIRKNKRWQEELKALRAIILDTPLIEEVKWRVPCYTLDGSNVVILGAFKDNCVISFVKGALLKDAAGILEKPGEDTQSARVVRFRSAGEIGKLEDTLKAYIHEAIEIEKAGLKVEMKKITDRPVPEELQIQLDKNPALKTAFRSLTPGRQRAYLMHFSSAKQTATREARVKKCMPQILKGKGLDD